MNHLSELELVLALDGEMEEAELKRAVDHLAECDGCRGQWEKLQRLSARAVEYSAGLYPVTSKPLAADERRLTRIENKKSAFVLPVWKWSFAAVMLVGVSMVLWSASHSSNAHPIAQEQNPRHKAGALIDAGGQSEKQVPLAAFGSVRNDTSKTVTDSAVKVAKSLKPLHKTPSAAKPHATLAQFTELPFSDASLPLDDATVVRVTLPASALRQAGVAVSEDNASAMLQADVVLGLDGLPRGIRLVKNGGTN